MRNYLNRGDRWRSLATAPRSSGVPFVLGSLVAIPTGDAKIGEYFDAVKVGVFMLPKSAEVFAQGEILDWDSAGGYFKLTGSGVTGDIVRAAKAEQPAADTDRIARIELTPDSAAPFSSGGGGGGGTPSDAVPQEVGYDADSGTNYGRIGKAGTSTDYSRADHVHPSTLLSAPMVEALRAYLESHITTDQANHPGIVVANISWTRELLTMSVDINWDEDSGPPATTPTVTIPSGISGDDGAGTLAIFNFLAMTPGVVGDTNGIVGVCAYQNFFHAAVALTNPTPDWSGGGGMQFVVTYCMAATTLP